MSPLFVCFFLFLCTLFLCPLFFSEQFSVVFEAPLQAVLKTEIFYIMGHGDRHHCLVDGRFLQSLLSPSFYNHGKLREQRYRKWIRLFQIPS